MGRLMLLLAPVVAYGPCTFNYRLSDCSLVLITALFNIKAKD